MVFDNEVLLNDQHTAINTSRPWVSLVHLESYVPCHFGALLLATSSIRCFIALGLGIV
jgi:hypothetical protein